MHFRLSTPPIRNPANVVSNSNGLAVAVTQQPFEDDAINDVLQRYHRSENLIAPWTLWRDNVMTSFVGI